jgi:enamine deaminase RidA (YjgF/YER057c/UK114 family)
MLHRAIATAAVLLASISALGQVMRIPLPDNSPFPISEGVWVGDTLYLSGTMGLPKSGPAGDTKTQTIAAITTIQKELEEQKLTLGDVVMMHVYLAADPAKDNKLDFAGFMAGYTQFFGTTAQPNKPARSAMQVAALVVPAGLVEIEVIAVRKK